MKDGKQSRILPAAVIVLALLFAAGAGLLLSGWPQPQQESMAEAGITTETPAQTTLQTASHTAAVTTTVTEAPAETTSSVTETALPDDPYAQYLADVLIPKYGRAAEGCAEQAEQTGIAAAYRCDFLGKGADDLLVVRLDMLDGISAPVPVLLLYTTLEGQTVLADSFESKLPLSGYRIRCADRTVYISGDTADAAMSPESWKHTEIVVQIQDNRDMILMNMEQESGETAPKSACPADAALLLEMLPDDSDPAARRYLLCQYTALP